MTPIITTITSNFQVYLPEYIRKIMKITRSTQAKISVKNNKIIIEPSKGSILDAAGMFAGSKPIKPMKMNKERDYIDYGRW